MSNYKDSELWTRALYSSQVHTETKISQLSDACDKDDGGTCLGLDYPEMFLSFLTTVPGPDSRCDDSLRLFQIL